MTSVRQIKLHNSSAPKNQDRKYPKLNDLIRQQNKCIRDNKATCVMTREEKATDKKEEGSWNLIQDGGHSEVPARPTEASSGRMTLKSMQSIPNNGNKWEEDAFKKRFYEIGKKKRKDGATGRCAQCREVGLKKQATALPACSLCSLCLPGSQGQAWGQKVRSSLEIMQVLPPNALPNRTQ